MSTYLIHLGGLCPRDSCHLGSRWNCQVSSLSARFFLSTTDYLKYNQPLIDREGDCARDQSDKAQILHCGRHLFEEVAGGTAPGRAWECDNYDDGF